MKRTSLLLGLTFLILGGGYYVYWSLQPATPTALRAKGQIEPVPRPFPMTQGDNTLRAGTGSWLKEFDEDTGALRRQFRAAEYLPQQNGTVHVISPEVWFYGDNHQEMHLTGIDGDIVVKDMPSLTAKSTDNSPATPPSRGLLNHVTIEMFSATSPPGVPDEVMTTDNLQFDNDTLLITTESYTDAAGHVIAKDQVPVHVRGKYDFDGRGLSMRWNDRDGRLERLDIANGEWLAIKDSSAFPGLTGAPGGSRPAPASAPSSAAMGPLVLPEMLASADPSAAAQVVGANRAPPTTRPRRGARGAPRQKPQNSSSNPTPYLAVFNDNVRITQGDSVLATADRMEVDFLQKSDARPTTAPAATQTASAGAPSGAQSPPGNTSDLTPAPTSQPQTLEAATQPATRPAQPPTIVRWTGKLTVIPAPPDRHQPLQNGDAVVSLFGQPAHIVRLLPEQKKRQEVRSAVVVYHTGDGSVALHPSPSAPQAIINEYADGRADPVSTLITESLDQLAADHVANLGGAGHVIVPADDNAPEKGNLVAKWDRGAKVYLLGGGPGESREISVRQMDLAGNVDVKHPQLSLNSQLLSLFFDTDAGPTTRQARGQSMPQTNPTTEPAHDARQQLKRVLARTDVHTVLTNSEGQHQTIDGQELELLTARGPTGEFQPRQVNAEGQVHAFDAEQDLRTRRLELTLRPVSPSTATTAPTTSPADKGNANSVELEKMLAIGDVVASSTNGSVATGDRMQVDMIAGEPHVRLTSASGNAKVIDEKKNIITGPVITSQTKRQLAAVDGPGTIQATMADSNGSNPRPVFVSWKKQADLNGPANTVDADEQIQFNTVEPDGKLVEAHGDRVHIDLEQKPQPTTQPTVAHDAGVEATTAAHRATALGPTTAPDSGNPMEQKQVKAVTLYGTKGNAGVYTTLLDAHNQLMLARAIEGPTIIYQSTGSAEQPARSIIVPAEGRMLMQDHRASEQRDPNDSGTGMGNGRGDTAFHWEKQFVYSEDQHRAVMNGNVNIAYRSLDSKEEPVRINAAVVTAEFDPAKPVATTRPATTRPTTRPSDGSDMMQIRSIVADADEHSPATVKRGDSELRALQITFDPRTHKFVALGTLAQPAVYSSPTMGVQTAQRIEWDTVNWLVSAKNANIRARGSGTGK